ncbi:RNA-directed DNA polymerase, eukaryota, reverse transcriptase zinc-binding domain protein [Tanacetum coccineum]
MGNSSGRNEIRRNSSTVDNVDKANEIHDDNVDKSKEKGTMDESNMKCNKEKISSLVMKASTSNRFTLLNELVGDEELIPSVEERKIVDEYMNKENEGAKEMEIEEDVEEVIQNLEEEFGVREEITRGMRISLGMSTSDKQKEVRNLMNEEKLQLCGIIETHVKYSKILKIGEKVFGNWDFICNGKDNNQGCRIMVGWNPNKLRYMLATHILRERNYGGIWELRITNGEPWVIIGDFNVSLKVEKHSNGSSALTNEMNEFLDCTREIEVERILSSGFHFTWTKIFLPYLISDHSPAVLKMPNGMEKRRKVFRFSNFVTDKKEFLPTVKKAWETEIDGHIIYPHDGDIKAKSCKVLQEYYKALNEENSLLMQKAKIEWLKDGDRNTKFFHKIIKGRMHKGRIMSVCNEKGERYENKKVAEQFVKHFKEFLGKKDLVIEFPADRIVFPNKLSSDEADRMCRGISEVEVKNAMFGIDDSKAPGPDGFTARFYKSAWSIIGMDVSKAI